jgi:hypothetical protein
MSVDFVSALEADGLSALDLIDAHFDRGHGLVTLTVAGIRQVNPPLGIAADPLAGRQSHALVFAYTRERFSGSQKKQLKKSVVEWAFVPEQKRLQ